MNKNIMIQTSLEELSDLFDKTAQKCEQCIHAQQINGDSSELKVLSCKPTKNFTAYDLTTFQIRNKCFLGYNIIKGYQQKVK